MIIKGVIPGIALCYCICSLFGSLARPPYLNNALIVSCVIAATGFKPRQQQLTTNKFTYTVCTTPACTSCVIEFS